MGVQSPEEALCFPDCGCAINTLASQISRQNFAPLPRMSTEIDVQQHEPLPAEKVLTKKESSKTLQQVTTDKSFVRAIAAEFIATTLFIYIGTGAVLAELGVRQEVDGSTDALTIVGIALAFGIGIVVLAYAIGGVSGGHINPAVTLAFAITGEIHWIRLVGYWVAQFAGGIMGSLLLRGSFELQEGGSYIGGGSTIEKTVNALSGTIGQGLLVEMILTYLLVFVVFQTAVKQSGNAMAPLAIGFAVFCAHIVAIPMTGTGINPARSFGPAVVSGEFTDLWVYFVGPFVGATLAALTSVFVL